MINKDVVKKIADLARLTLSDDETTRLTGELSNIMQYVESLSAVDVSQIKPTAHAVEVQNVFRPDETQDAHVIDKVLEQAPKAEDGLFLVPKVL